MAQDDYNLTNLTFPNTRAKINLTNAAARSNNSGATEPSSTAPYMWWPDTTSGLMKQRNAADSDWVTIGILGAANWGLLPLAGGTLTGALLASSGLVGTPGIAAAGDANTGIYFPAADTMAATAGGAEAWRVNSNQQTTVPNGTVSLPSFGFTNEPSTGLFRPGSNTLACAVFGVEIWRATANGLAVGYTDVIDVAAGSSDGVTFAKSGFIAASLTANASLRLRRRTSDGNIALFYRDTTQVGSISVTGSATAYNTSSDYRLKEDIEPMEGALERIARLKPCRFSWKAGSKGRVDGFIAHEAQEVVPEAVHGEKDATEEIGTIKNAKGKVVESGVVEPSELPEGHAWKRTGTRPIYQGIDQSKLVPLLTAGMQELMAEVKALRERIEALEGA